MKIHTVRKYLASLPAEPGVGMALRVRKIFEAACALCREDYSFPRSSVVTAVGKDAEYSVSIPALALTAPNGTTSALIIIDRVFDPVLGLKIDGETVREDKISRAFGDVRCVCAADDAFVGATAFEVSVAAVLLVCARERADKLFFCFRENVAAEFALIIPQSAILLLGASNADDMALFSALMRRGVREVVSAPQSAEIYRTLTGLCAEVNCRLDTVVRSEINVEERGFSGISFSYRGISAFAPVHFDFMLPAAVAGIECCRAAGGLGELIDGEREKRAIADLSPSGRADVISYSPLVIRLSARGGRAEACEVREICEFVAARGASAEIFLQPDVVLDGELDADVRIPSENFGELVSLSGTDAAVVIGSPEFTRAASAALERKYNRI